MKRDHDLSGDLLEAQQSRAAPFEGLTPELDLARPGITIYRWRLTHAEILIEVFVDGRILVNGELVVPFVPNRPEVNF